MIPAIGTVNPWFGAVLTGGDINFYPKNLQFILFGATIGCYEENVMRVCLTLVQIHR